MTRAYCHHLTVLSEISTSPEQVAAISFDVCLEDLDWVAFGVVSLFGIAVWSDDLHDHGVLSGEFELQLRQPSFNDSLEDVDDVCFEHGEHVESFGITQPRVHLDNCRSLVFCEHHLPANHAVVGFAGFFLDGLNNSLDDLERLVILFASNEWEGHVGT